MGNICSALKPPKKMIAPRDIYELADTVEAELLAQDGADLEQVTLKSPWAAAYHRSPRMVDERRELFFFVVICSVLLRIPPTEKEKNERLIEMARKRFFSDNEFWQCAIAFADVHNTLDEIFRLYYAEEKNSLMSQMSSQITSLRQKLISLRQDEVIRSSLEPVYGVFLKAGHEHPGNILQQCILSLL